MSDQWMHTAAIITTIKNVNRDEKTPPSDVYDNHPLMMPREEREPEGTPKLSMWEAFGEREPR